VWQIAHRRNDTGHGTEKPVECMRRPIENNSSPGQAVFDPFSGSGTTIVAAEMTGRACQAIEIDPAYVDVAIHRWQEFAGETAILEGDGRTFAEVKAGRHAHTKKALQAAGSGARAADGIPGGVNAARAEIPVHEASFAESGAFVAACGIEEDN
jgi:hypothetical protein